MRYPPLCSHESGAALARSCRGNSDSLATGAPPSSKRGPAASAFSRSGRIRATACAPLPAEASGRGRQRHELSERVLREQRRRIELPGGGWTGPSLGEAATAAMQSQLAALAEQVHRREAILMAEQLPSSRGPRRPRPRPARPAPRPSRRAAACLRLAR